MCHEHRVPVHGLVEVVAGDGDDRVVLQLEERAVPVGRPLLRQHELERPVGRDLEVVAVVDGTDDALRVAAVARPAVHRERQVDGVALLPAHPVRALRDRSARAGRRHRRCRRPTSCTGRRCRRTGAWPGRPTPACRGRPGGPRRSTCTPRARIARRSARSAPRRAGPRASRAPRAARGRPRRSRDRSHADFTASPTLIVPSVRISARSPPRCTSILRTPVRVCSSRYVHGCARSTPRKRTSPTVNSCPMRWLSATPVVTRLRRVSPSASSTPYSATAFSIASRSMSVTARCACSSRLPEYFPASSRVAVAVEALARERLHLVARLHGRALTRRDVDADDLPLEHGEHPPPMMRC